MSGTNAAVEAISYAIDTNTDEGIEFLRCWTYGDFGTIRREWPDCPEACFVGADPAHGESQTKVTVVNRSGEVVQVSSFWKENLPRDWRDRIDWQTERALEEINNLALAAQIKIEVKSGHYFREY